MNSSQACSHFNAFFEGVRYFHAEIPWLLPALIIVLAVTSSITGGNDTTTIATIPSPALHSRLTSRYKWLENAHGLIKLGLNLHGRFGRSFKVVGPSRWYLLIAKPELIEELRGLPQSTMSFRHCADEQLRTDLIFYKGFMAGGAVSRMIRKHLSDRNSLTKVFPLLQEEHRLGWRENIPSELQNVASTAWVEVDVMSTLQAVIARTANHVYFGVELARNVEFEKAVLEFIRNWVVAATKIDAWPLFLQPLAVKWLYGNWKKSCFATVKAFLGPVVEERREKLQRLGEAWVDRPHDSIQHVVEDEPEASTDVLISRLIFLVSGSVHNDKFSLLACYDALSSCLLLDSVMKENSRLYGSEIIPIRRRCMKDYTFSDGSHVTPGAWVMVCAAATHCHASIYPDPERFDGFRFKKLREQSGKENSYQFVQPSVDFLTFGHGRFVCPGRFFAATMLKVLLVELLEEYEWKFRDGEGMPQISTFGINSVPGRAKVLFRRVHEEV